MEESAQSMREATAAIIAAYNPDDTLLPNVALAAGQVGHVFVVDDGSSAPGVPDLLNELERSGATVIRQPSNGGIASALNTGIRKALQNKAVEYVLTLDQDSGIGPDYVLRCHETLNAARRTHHDIGFVAAERFGSTPFPSRGTADGLRVAIDPLQSGCLIPRSTIDALGYLDETLFIDGVDSEYTARNMAARRLVLIGTGCWMSHNLGDRRQVRAWGRTTPLSYNYHPPARVYYMARNGAVLLGRYGRQLPSWVLRRSVEELKAHTLRVVFSPNRAAVGRAICFGLADALRGRLGKIPERTLQKIHAGGSS